MKVILLVDIKGKGQKGDIKDFQAGYANFLIKNNQAVQATDNNLADLEVQKQKEAEEAQALLEEMKDYKARIEATSFEIGVRLAPDGHILGSITNKQLSELIEEKLGIKVDKRKINLKEKYDSVGEYSVAIQLHHEVTCNMKFKLVEIKK